MPPFDGYGTELVDPTADLAALGRQRELAAHRVADMLATLAAEALAEGRPLAAAEHARARADLLACVE